MKISKENEILAAENNKPGRGFFYNPNQELLHSLAKLRVYPSGDPPSGCPAGLVGLNISGCLLSPVV